LTKAGVDHAAIGRDDDALSRIGTFVELHVEQGRGLVDLDRPVGVATSIWPHGRWRFDFTGEANHAGTTLPDDRRDPMLTFASTVLAARTAAEGNDARATFGRVLVEPNGTNAIPSAVTGWLDARARNEASLDDVVADIGAAAAASGESDRVGVAVTSESYTTVTDFDPALRDGIATLIDHAPLLPTAAGHDAGILATAGIPTAMLFVRNPTGVSHSPAEHAEEADCLAGTDALAAVLANLACR
ncbi:MAG: M20/M25/M40 family metallo-hydrolase, partial [Actinophytocola sp.]|nr:M20/M25/M40 family metallo-hydrolase [Actinophytocola sp.]